MINNFNLSYWVIHALEAADFAQLKLQEIHHPQM